MGRNPDKDLTPFETKFFIYTLFIVLKKPFNERG
jgi:hypothetical protein